jgi:hypothetical protein
MSEQIIESLKDWFEKDWLYDRHLTTEFVRDKEAFNRGCRTFELKQFSLPEQLFFNLKKEAGLAEVARMNNSLLKYAYHSYRMVELVFNLIFSTNFHDENKSDLKSYLRFRLYNYLGSKSLDNELIKQVYKYEIIAGVQNLTCFHSSDSSKKIKFNLGDIITYVSEKTKVEIEKNKRFYSNNKRYIEFEMDGYYYSVFYKDLLIRNSVPSRNLKGYYELDKISSISKCENFFKKSFYFDLNKTPRKMSVQLNAFFSMKHFRDLYSHNISSYSQKVNIFHPTYEDEKYLKNPELILDSDYFERYVDNVIELYADFLVHPHF